jgi:hypothetical protein
MSMLNFELFEAFKSAAKHLKLEVKPDWDYYSIVLPNNDYYAYCWTPMNKMVNIRREERTPDLALKHMEDNFDDFHLEFGYRFTYCMDYFPEVSRSATKQDIIKMLERMIYPEVMEKYKTYHHLKYGFSENEE